MITNNSICYPASQSVWIAPLLDASIGDNTKPCPQCGVYQKYGIEDGTENYGP